jgi:hypothetical protein
MISAFFAYLSFVPGRPGINAIYQLPHHQSRAFAISQHDNIGKFHINRVPNSEQVPENSFRIIVLKERAISVPTGSLDLLLNRCFQVDHNRVTLQQVMIFFPHYCTATGRKDRLWTPGELSQHCGFTLPKPILAFHIKNPGNIRPTTLLDDPIGIQKTIAQLSGQHAANRAFACPHRAYQDNSFWQGHNFRSFLFRRVRIAQGNAFHKFRKTNRQKKPPCVDGGFSEGRPDY